MCSLRLTNIVCSSRIAIPGDFSRFPGGCLITFAQQSLIKFKDGRPQTCRANGTRCKRVSGLNLCKSDPRTSNMEAKNSRFTPVDLSGLVGTELLNLNPRAEVSKCRC